MGWSQVEQLESIVPGLRSRNAELEREKDSLQKELGSFQSELRQQGESLDLEKRRFAEKQSKLETTIENLRARQVEHQYRHMQS